MGKSQKPRKQYRPKEVVQDPVAYAIQGARLTPQAAVLRQRGMELEAIDAMATGKADQNTWGILHAMVILSETMGKAGVGPEALPAAGAALAALDESWGRFAATRRMGITGPGLQALREVFEYLDLQRQSVSLREFIAYVRRGIDIGGRRFDEKHGHTIKR